MIAATMAITLRKRTRLGIAFRVPIRPAQVPAARLVANVDAAFGIKGALANTLPIDDPRVVFGSKAPPPLVAAHRIEYDHVRGSVASPAGTTGWLRWTHGDTRRIGPATTRFEFDLNA